MIAIWMLYATLVTGILAAAAHAAERVCAARRWARRWVWLAAIGGTMALPLVAFVRPASRADSGAPASGTPSVDASATGRPPLVAMPSWLEDAMRGARARAAFVEGWHVPVLVAWALATSCLLGAFVAGARTLAARRREWRDDVVDGERVLLAHDTGPAVVGALRPRIVLPSWALGLPRDERAMMLAHEREHVRSGDPLLLHIAALATTLLPWNGGLWWIVRRLRLAVELDCDARVLRATHDAHAYGALLVTVGSRRTGAPLPLAAPALLERPSSLERRITAMLPASPRFPRLSVAVAASVAIGAIVVACEMPSPEMLAPDGRDVAAQRVYGAWAVRDDSEVVMRADVSWRDLVLRRHPEIGEPIGPSIVFLVADANGQVVMSERQEAAQAKMPSSNADSLAGAAGPRAGGRIAPTESELERRRRVELASRSAGAPAAPQEAQEVPLERRRQAEVAGVLRMRTSSGAAPRVPAGVGAIRPDEIASIEIAKYAAGRIGPDPVSIIFIALKPGARVPSRIDTP